MHSRFVYFLVIVSLCATHGSAQTVRFDTNVGNFDVVLNPDNNSNLQAHVDNFLAYVEGGFYNDLLLNRADDRNSTDGNDGMPEDDFVLQMGRFRINSIFQPSNSLGFIDNRGDAFDPVIVDADGNGTVDFDTTGLTNTRGKISLALAGSNSNSGTSEFFINLGDNSFLDPQDGFGADFVTFAEVPDMTTIDLIFRLNNANLFGGAFTDVPLLDNGTLVFVERAFELSAPGGAPAGQSSGSVGPGVAAVPEPSSLALAAAALMFMATSVRRGVKSRAESREPEIVRAD